MAELKRKGKGGQEKDRGELLGASSTALQNVRNTGERGGKKVGWL